MRIGLPDRRGASCAPEVQAWRSFRWGTRHALLRLAGLTALLLVAAGAAGATRADALVKDEDYWKGTTDRQATVNRLVYSQSPQSIPTSYDPVREAEEILRAKQSSLPSTNPKSASVWSQLRNTTVRTGLSAAPRALGVIALGPDTFKLGWKLGSGFNAKLFKFDIPPAGGCTSTCAQRLQPAYGGFYDVYGPDPAPPEDYFMLEYEGAAGYWGRLVTGPTSTHPYYCQPSGPAAMPAVFQTGFYTETGCHGAHQYAWWISSNDLPAAGPIEPYIDQPYDRETYAPGAPPQTTVEQTIDTALADPAYADLRQWLNYHLGSPGETDPLGIGDPNPDIAFPNRQKKFEDHKDDFASPYTDVHEYWEDAAEIVNRPNVEHCQRSDGSTIYWDPVREAIVIVTDGEIQTYFPPDDGYDYYDAQCAA